MTDPHLDMLKSNARATFLEELASDCKDGLLITGDIAEGDELIPTLEAIDAAVSVPVYFVLGNHDYYRSSIGEVRMAVKAFSARSQRVRWLPALGVTALSSNTALVGHGGWSDGKAGDFLASQVNLNDYRLIEDLKGQTKEDLLRRLIALGNDSADALAPHLEMALEAYENVIVATHSPPFSEACWYQGQAEINEWTPHFTCIAMGEMLRRKARHHPDRHIRVFCGHTHSGGYVKIDENLEVFTGDSHYGAPALQTEIVLR